MNPDPSTPPLAGLIAGQLPTRIMLARALWAGRAQFAALGVLTGTWGVHIPSVKTRYGLDEVNLSLVLLAAACGAVLSVFFAGHVIGRLGTRSATLLGGCVMCAMFALVLVWPGMALLLATMFCFGASLSVFDVAINSEGTVIESLGGRTVMSNLHGMFSVGGMVGAALSSSLLHAAVSPLLQLLAISALIAVVIAVASRFMLDAHPDSAGPGQAHFAWPRGLLLVIGLLILTGMTAEGVMYDWSVLYLKQELQMEQAQAALGFATFSAAMAVSRFGGDALRARFPEPLLLGAGAAVAALAMAVVIVSGHPWVAMIGFALVGAGLAPVVPILFNAATRVQGVSRAAAIASVSSIGYAGYMIGPPLIGGIAHGSSLTVAMGVVVFAAALLAIFARRIP